MTLILEPHNDDCALFAAFTAIPARAHVVTVFRSFAQESRGGTTAAVREAESRSAMAVLGCTWETLPFRDDRPVPLIDLSIDLARLALEHGGPVYAPAYEQGGHEQHNVVAEAAAVAFGSRVRFYATYRRGCGRTRTSLRVDPEPGWVVLKHLALAMYGSQIHDPTTRPWFLDKLEEWLMPTHDPVGGSAADREGA